MPTHAQPNATQNQTGSPAKGLARAEWGIAGLLTLSALWLRIEAAQCAGGLWRDEVNTVALASLPTFSDLYANLQFDSFPVLWLAFVRCLVRLGLHADWHFRTVGLFVGFMILAALWFTARQFRIRFPFFSLLLLGFSPALICFGDSMRAYGFGVFWILVAYGLIWGVVESPTFGRVLSAALAAIGSVHTLYQNVVLLFAICAAGIAVSLLRGQRHTSLLLVLVGALAALPLLAYAPVFARAGQWWPIIQSEFSFGLFLTGLMGAMGPGAPSVIAWLACAPLGALVAVGAFVSRSSTVPPAQKGLILFCGTTLVLAAIGYFLFLTILSHSAQPWYFLPLLALGAASFDALFSLLALRTWSRIVRLALACVLGPALFWAASEKVRIRLTNVDLIAANLNALAEKRDFVLLDPWFIGVSFDRYYSGRADWMTLPPLDSCRFHRFDLIKEKMVAPDQMATLRPLVDKIAEALRSGGRVWLVGELRSEGPHPALSLLPPASARMSPRCSAAMYQDAWASQVDSFLVSHARQIQAVQVSSALPILLCENELLITFNGWRDPAQDNETSGARILTRQAALQEAIFQWQTAAGPPGPHGEGHLLLGNAFAAEVLADQTIARLRQLLPLESHLADTQLKLATLLLNHQRVSEALEQYRQVLRITPNAFEPMNNLAWLLATHPDAKIRNGAEAVRLAERALLLASSNSPAALDTLGAAYAEAGRFADASAAIEKAIGQAVETGHTNSLAGFRSRLELYRQQRPYHAPQ